MRTTEASIRCSVRVPSRYEVATPCASAISASSGVTGSRVMVPILADPPRGGPAGAA
ncbi:hypothetical protein [Pseudonocardia sp. EC080619-01]|uniref:hypothetical protein n=1 Tax=Pseudonocardia sp. EC080619-01 TaxID=1096856 RepID=UPI001D05266C|nr:hypothetical protein [Pseudonocardia sp. EC080619-01]